MASQVVKHCNIGRGKGKRKSDCGSFTVGKGYRKTIGLKRGNILARFWLGFDEREATIKAKLIEAIWLRSNASHWSPEALQEAERVRRTLITSNEPEANQKPMIESVVADRSNQLTIADGVEKYCNMVDMKDCSPSHKSSTRHRLKKITRLKGSLPLASLDTMELSSIVSLLRSKTDTHNIIRTTKAFLRWLDDMELWEAPRRFERIFPLARKVSSSVKIATFTIEQLTQMYSAADKRIRLWMLLSLNCGFANMEVATLKQSEVDLQCGYIERVRGKTGVSGKWKLWSETIEALKPYCKGKDDTLVLTSEAGTPLVYYSEHYKRVDTLGQCWVRFMKRAKVPFLGFKFLRKTGATMIRSIDGIEVSETYLSHADKGIARFYSIPDASRLNNALEAMRERLASMFSNIK